MDKKLKLFAACCAIALTLAVSTSDGKAEGDTYQNGTTITITENPPAGGGSCVGDGVCGTTKNGTKLVGKWKES